MSTELNEDKLIEDQERLEEQEELDRVVEKTGLDEDVVAAALILGIPENSISEAYQGQFVDDKAFAFDLADNMNSEILSNWPYTSIDWEDAASDLMADYSEENGYYFRNM